MASAPGETDINVLLRSMRPQLDTKEYVFCSVSSSKVISDEVTPLCIFQEDEGTTFILEVGQAEACKLEWSFRCSRITLQIHSSLEAVGFLARISSTLAAEGISVNAVSAFYHDHLFVPIEKAQLCITILQRMIREAARAVPTDADPSS